MKAVGILCLMATIEKTIVVPMIRVRCMSVARREEWPQYVQVLPEVNDVIVSNKGTCCFVKKRRFMVDGTIELVLEY
jgi:hypothetical protein